MRRLFYATLRRTMRGRVATWKKGTRCTAEKVHGCGWVLSRLRPTPHPILNGFVGVPRAALELHEPVPDDVATKMREQRLRKERGW
jgi:hypothetical protein